MFIGRSGNSSAEPARRCTSAAGSPAHIPFGEVIHGNWIILLGLQCGPLVGLLPPLISSFACYLSLTVAPQNVATALVNNMHQKLRTMASVKTCSQCDCVHSKATRVVVRRLTQQTYSSNGSTYHFFFFFSSTLCWVFINVYFGFKSCMQLILKSLNRQTFTVAYPFYTLHIRQFYVYGL